jgi:hypothetical protein
MYTLYKKHQEAFSKRIPITTSFSELTLGEEDIKKGYN